MKALVSCFFLMALTLPTAVAAESLFTNEGYKPLVSDHIAHRPGDTLTVLVVEQASATASAESSANKATDVDVDLTDGHTPIDGRASISNDFTGGGTVNRAGRLSARVSVTVVSRLPSGEMLVEGKQLIEFNNEKQNIAIRGRVRPQDISADNTVLSSRLAEAEIEYLGDGLLSTREKPGLITRFFNWLF